MASPSERERWLVAVGFPGGQAVQRQLLEQDGIYCDERWRIIDFEERRWRPKL